MNLFLAKTTRVISSSPQKIPAILGLLLFCAALAGCKSLPANSLATHDSSRWAKDMATFKASDATNPPPRDCIVFVGSSSVRLWKTLAQDFPDMPVVNRGFGGSQLADVYKFADQIVIPYKPRQVIIYAGGNDINAGKDPKLVFGDMAALAARIKNALPHTRVGVISIAPSPSRWAQVEKVREYNRLAENYCTAHKMDFINVFPLMLGPDGNPLPDIYVKDRLHMNEKGYAIWKKTVEPYLIK